MNSIKFLIVDDYEFSKIFFENAVHYYNYQYVYVQNGRRAIEELIKNDFDIVLMDIEMPVMDGIEATKYIRNKLSEPKKSIPIVAITGHTDEDFLDDLKNLGFTDYMSKMFTRESIYEIANKYVAPKEKFYTLKFKEYPIEIDKKLERELVIFFVENTPKTIELLYEALNVTDWKKLKDIFHKFTNQLNYFGLDNASKLSENLEKTNFHNFHEQKTLHNIKEIEKNCLLAIKDLKIDYKL